MADKYMDVTEFRNFGYLQELNRQFLHPLGLALAVTIGDDDAETLGPIVDSRDDPEGMVLETVNPERAQRVADEQQRRKGVRIEALGYNVQPGLETDVTEEDLFDNGYTAGRKAAYSEMLTHAFRVLGVDDPMGRAALLHTDMEAVEHAIKNLWEDTRNDPYPKGANLPDMIEIIAREFIE